MTIGKLEYEILKSVAGEWASSEELQLLLTKRSRLFYNTLQAAAKRLNQSTTEAEATFMEMNARSLKWLKEHTQPELDKFNEDVSRAFDECMKCPKE